jgi:hypothetical protein
MHRHAVAHGVVFGDRRVHLHLVLADLGAVIGAFAHQIGLGEALRGRAELEQHVALDIAGLLLVQQRCAGRERVLRCIVGRQFLDGHLDAAQRLARGVVVERGDGRDRLAAVAHSVARQRIFGARDRQHAEALVAVGAGDDGDDARHLQRRRHVDADDLGVRVGAAVDAAGQLPRRHDIGGVFGAPGDFLRAVDHRHVAADIMRGHRLVHAVASCAKKPSAVIPGRPHSASKTRVNALMGPDPESILRSAGIMDSGLAAFGRAPE